MFRTLSSAAWPHRIETWVCGPTVKKLGPVASTELFYFSDQYLFQTAARQVSSILRLTRMR
jgi:hypothetical protein